MWYSLVLYGQSCHGSRLTEKQIISTPLVIRGGFTAWFHCLFTILLLTCYFKFFSSCVVCVVHHRTSRASCPQRTPRTSVSAVYCVDLMPSPWQSYCVHQTTVHFLLTRLAGVDPPQMCKIIRQVLGTEGGTASSQLTHNPIN